MKKLIMVFLLTFFLIGCDDTQFKHDNPAQETSTLIHNAAKADTTNTLYKVYEGDNNRLYLINAETNLKEYTIINQTGDFTTAMLMVFILIMLLFIVLGVAVSD